MAGGADWQDPEYPAGPIKGLPLAIAKTDIREEGQVRSHQLKMGKKVIEERRRKEEEGEEGMQSRKPRGAGTKQAQLMAKWERTEKEGRGGKRGPAKIGLGQPGVLLEPAGAESVYLVSH